MTMRLILNVLLTQGLNFIINFVMEFCHKYKFLSIIAEVKININYNVLI